MGKKQGQASQTYRLESLDPEEIAKALFGFGSRAEPSEVASFQATSNSDAKRKAKKMIEELERNRPRIRWYRFLLWANPGIYGIHKGRLLDLP